MTYIPVTVGRRVDGFTVTRGPRPTFTVAGHPGAVTTTPTVDGVLFTEGGDVLLAETGALLAA